MAMVMTDHSHRCFCVDVGFASSVPGHVATCLPIWCILESRHFQMTMHAPFESEASSFPTKVPSDLGYRSVLSLVKWSMTACPTNPKNCTGAIFPKIHFQMTMDAPFESEAECFPPKVGSDLAYGQRKNSMVVSMMEGVKKTNFLLEGPNDPYHISFYSPFLN